MREINRTRVIQAVRRKVRSGSIVFCPLAILLCLISAVTGVTFLFDGTLHARDEQHGQKGVEELSPTVMNRPGVVSFGRALTKSGPSEDHLWRERKGIRKDSREAGGKLEFYRALSLNEIAQREVLRQVPMELTKEASQTQVIMSLPMLSRKTLTAYSTAASAKLCQFLKAVDIACRYIVSVIFSLKSGPVEPGSKSLFLF